jgi:hypothetical protein
LHSSAPFLQPIWVTVRTSWPVGRSASGRGSDSSRRSRARGQQVLGHFQCRHSLFACDRWKMVEESIEVIAGSEVIEQVLDRDACARKHRSTPEHVWIASDDGFTCRHVGSASIVHLTGDGAQRACTNPAARHVRAGGIGRQN